MKDGDTVISPEEYDVSYRDNVNAGTATVTVRNKAGGNYTVSGSATFEIGKAASEVRTAPGRTPALSTTAVSRPSSQPELPSAAS